jgi:lipopolysaccharide/colanic/teichoic acid biosynthesis glycosyltransferase
LQGRLDERRPAAVLGHDEFLERLWLEKRRADRSGAALSLVLLRPSGPGPDRRAPAQPRHIRAALLMARLRELVRETDLLGQMDSGDCAVLLPDTDARGLQGFVARIGRELRAGAGPELAMTAATYPDQLFENLGAGREVVPLGSLMLDDTGPAAPAGYTGKRVLDLVGASLALVLLAPLMAAVALAVAVSSPGPVVFRQLRLGRGGAPFVFYKFRTMTHGADDGVHRDFVTRLITGAGPAAVSAPNVQADGQAPGGFKLQQDPRVTQLGRFLRRTSLDELPQFFNVLRGDMSLVGPRPPIPYEARHYRAWHLRRLLQLKPGLTGPWQVSGRSQVPFDEMVRMDLRYIARCSLALDLLLLVRTVGVVLSGRGAR